MPWSFATLNPQLFGSVIPVCKQPVTTLALDRCPLGRAVLDLPLRLGATPLKPHFQMKKDTANRSCIGIQRMFACANMTKPILRHPRDFSRHPRPFGLAQGRLRRGSACIHTARVRVTQYCEVYRRITSRRSLRNCL